MANSNLFLKAKLTDRTSNAEDTLRVLCEYTEAGDTPTTPVTINSLNPPNNFTVEIGTTNIIRYIPDSSKIVKQTGTSLSLDLGGSDNILEILAITFPEVASAPLTPDPKTVMLRYGAVGIGALSYDSNAIGNGSSLVFIVQYKEDYFEHPVNLASPITSIA